MSRRTKPATGFSERSKVSKKISASIPNDAFECLRTMAVQRGVSLSQVAREAIVEFTEREAQTDG